MAMCSGCQSKYNQLQAQRNALINTQTAVDNALSNPECKMSMEGYDGPVGPEVIASQIIVGGKQIDGDVYVDKNDTSRENNGEIAKTLETINDAKTNLNDAISDIEEAMAALEGCTHLAEEEMWKRHS